MSGAGKNGVPIHETADAAWQGLYRAGGWAALLAAVVFRRNLAAEAALFGVQAPGSAVEWFALFEGHKWLGLVLLDFFDAVDYALVALTFLALCVLLWRTARSSALVAAACGGVGAAVYIASNTAVSMLALSARYAAAANDEQRALVAGAGQALLAGRGTAGQPTTAFYVSLLLLAVGGLLFSLAMLRDRRFGRAVAVVGIAASAFDLTYCIALVLLPASSAPQVGLLTQPAGGLFLMIWHILAGLKLLRLAGGDERRSGAEEAAVAR